MPQILPRTTLSLIIPFRNADITIKDTLLSLITSSLIPDEIILVNNNSADNTEKIVVEFMTQSRLPISLIKTPQNRIGAAAARNWGAKQASGNLLVFLDADVVVAYKTIETLLDYYVKTNVAGVVALFQPYSLQPGIWAHFQAFMVNSVYEGLDPDNSPCLGTQCVLLEKEIFHAMGGFDEVYKGATVEDFAFGYKMRHRNYCIGIATNAVIVHNHPYNWMSFTNNYFLKSCDLVKLLLKHPRIKLSDSGYHHPSNLPTLAIFYLQILFLLLTFTLDIQLFPIQLFLLLLVVVLWAKFFLCVRSQLGLLYGISFILIRVYIILIGGFGAIKGLIDLLWAREYTLLQLGWKIIALLKTPLRQ